LGFVSNCELEQCIDAMQIKFGTDVTAMMIHRAWADKKFSSDLYGRLVFSDQTQHTLFGGG
jgi:hypothetical protein